MAWVVAEGLREHGDYTSVIGSHVYSEVCKDYHISKIAERNFIEGLQEEEGVSSYDAVLLVMTPFDRLDVAVRRSRAVTGLDRRVVKQVDKGFGKMQNGWHI